MALQASHTAIFDRSLVTVTGNVGSRCSRPLQLPRSRRVAAGILPSSSLLPRWSLDEPRWNPPSSAASSRRETSCSYSSASSSGNAATADPFNANAGDSCSTSFPEAEMDRTASTLYDLLGISRTGSQAEIKDAYRQLARRYHPDVRPAGLSVEECTRRFIEVQEAYEILSDPQRRAMYDFEMMHGRKGRRMGVPAHAKATWRPRRRSAEEPPLWANFEDEAAVKASWKNQWGRQMDGLRNHRGTQPKPSSWAAQMRAQQEQEKQQQGGREEAHAQYAAQSQSFYDNFSQQEEEWEAPCA